MPSQKNTVMIDANVILRYLLRDDEKLYKKAESLFDEVFSGRRRALIIQPVIAEVVYVLQKLYKVRREEIAQVLAEFLKMKGVKVQDRDIVLESLEIFRDKNLDFVDCLLCAYSREYEGGIL
ncbi:MAG: PIN domain-containing protein [Aquificota bacterium]|nr:PIN domain-containing protein [Aquificota bacterium]